MKPENLALLAMLCQKDAAKSCLRNEPVLKASTKNLCGIEETIHTVWYSPTGFGGKDDAVEIGFIELPQIVRLNERACRQYKLSVVSTSVMELWKDNWALIKDLPHVSITHQEKFFPHLFVK